MKVRGAAVGVLLSCALAGCGTTGSGSGSPSSSSSVTATGSTLSIWLSEPPHPTAAEQDVIKAEQLAYDSHKSQVTRVGLRLRTASKYELSANARTAIQDKSAIAYLGELAPGSSEDTLGVTNALDLLQVSPTDNALEETQSSAAVPNSPDRYYETLSTYGHTFARLAPSTATEAAAIVAEMKKLGVRSLYVSSDGSDYGKAIAAAVKRHATSSSISVACGGADAKFYGWNGAGPPSPGSSTKLFLPSAAALSADLTSVAAGGSVYVSIPAPAPGTASQVASFDKAFKARYHHEPAPEAAFGYEAMSAVLSVLAQAGGSVKDRGTVVRDFHRIRDRSSLLGTYSIDKSGDSSLSSFRFLKLTGGKLVPLKGGPVQG